MCSKHKVNYESITKKKFDLQYIQDGLKRIGKTKRKSLKPLKKVESGRVKTVQEALF